MISARELFTSIMSYEPFDRMLVVHWDQWDETRERWITEGLPPAADLHRFLDAPFLWETLIDPQSWLSVGNPQDLITIGLFPPFEEEVLQKDGDFTVLRNRDGTMTRRFANRTAMPQYLGGTFTTAADWGQYKRRLQPDPARISPSMPKALEELSKSGRPLCFPLGSLMGWARNWMGLENLCFLIHDDRETFRDVVDTITTLTCWMMDQVLPLARFDLAHTWEDMCGVNGPLISPEVFRECVAPEYLRIRAKLDHYGVHLLEMDTDGDISRFARDLLDCGVNVLFPVEVGKFKGDAMALRKTYGRELRLVGNFDKMALEKGERAISTEIERLHPLMEQGGYVIMPDHHITPGVPLAAYKGYLERIRGLRF